MSAPILQSLLNDHYATAIAPKDAEIAALKAEIDRLKGVPATTPAHATTPAPVPQPAHAADPALIVKGNLIQRGGKRFVFKGWCQYALDQSWQDPCNGYYRHLDAILAKMGALDGNAQRLSFWSLFYKDGTLGGKAAQIARLVELCERAAKRGVYTLLCDHTSTGDNDATLAAARVTGHPMFTDLWTAISAKPEAAPYVMFEPWNEPGIPTEAGWVNHYTQTIRHLRAIGYKGIVYVDTRGWGWDFKTHVNAGSVDKLLAVDSQLVFCTHRYPKDLVDPTTYERDKAKHDETVMRFVGRYPMLVTEYGPNIDMGDPYGADHKDHPLWFSGILDAAVKEHIPAGLNGVFVWKWYWSTNRLTLDEWWRPEGHPNAVAWGPNGLLAEKHFYAPLKGINA
jgi:hypothetical protein